jgi:DNA-binding SARP family transcriptional activator
VIQSLKSTNQAPIYLRDVEYRVLGSLEVLSEGKPRPLGGQKQRAVLAVLVAAGGRAVTVDSLLQAIYGDDASPSSRATLHTYVSNLRGSLGDVIIRRADAYLLDLTGAVTDAAEFENAYNAAVQLGSAEDMASQLRLALSMWRGHPYADIEAHGHLDGQITRLNELRLAAIEGRVDADLRAGRHREVVAELDALTVEYPFRESLRAMHMLALYRCGRQGDALRAYAHTRVVLVEELGIDPSVELQELERRILQQDRQLLLDAAPTVQQRAVVVADIEDSGWSSPAQREVAFARRDSALAWAADEQGGVRLAQKGTAAYAVFTEPIQAVSAARAAVDERTRVAVDFGDLQVDDGEPIGPPLARAARLVAVAHPGQAVMSPAAHEALTVAGVAGWATQSLGRFDIVGLDRGMQIFQLVGDGFASGFPALALDRVPPPLPSGVERSIPGYELRALLGIGELGEVHRAYQASVGREVAVRVFGPGMVGHPQFLRRFETAAQRITRVEHPGVVPLLDYWREPTRAVLVSRLMTGGTLRDRIPDTGLDTATALHIFETVASAVASAHRRGIVHGRVRPHNVLLDDEGNAFIADLGVDEMCTGVTSFAASAYDAPERLGGVLATPASDIYSLGVLIHELLSGSAPPIDGALPTIDSPAADVVARATDSDPRRRHGSVEELATDLRQALIGRSETTAVFVPTLIQ